MNPFPQNQVAIIAPNWLGDCVMSLPALEYLQNASVRLQILVRQEFTRLFADVEKAKVVPYVGPHRLQRLRTARQLRRQPLAACLVLVPSFTGALLSVATGAPLRVGESAEARSWLLTRRLQKSSRSTHLALQYQSMSQEVLRLLGLVAPARKKNHAFLPIGLYGPPRLSAQEAERRVALELLEQCHLSAENPPLVVACGARFGAAKRYPAGLFAEAVRLIQGQLRVPVLLVGGRRDSSACMELQQLLPNSQNLAGKTSLAALIGILSLAAGVLSNDSGTMHLAAALGRPTLGIFGSTNPLWTRPLGRRAAYSSFPVWCSPCYKARCRQDFACMLEQSPELVAGKLLEQIALDSPDVRETPPGV